MINNTVLFIILIFTIFLIWILLTARKQAKTIEENLSKKTKKLKRRKEKYGF